MKMKLKHFAPIVLGTALTGCASQAPKSAQAEISQASLTHLSVAESAGAIAGEDAVAKEARLSDVYAELREAYIEKIRATLLAAWTDSGAAGHACKLKISQLPGGAILQADAVTPCSLGISQQRALEETIVTVQLPYRGFEAVFNRRIEVLLSWPKEAL